MRQQRFDLALVIAVALIANVAYFACSNGDFYDPDSFAYLAPARSMLHGRGFLNGDGDVDTIRTPGYPLLLAAFGATTLPVIVLQHLLVAALAGAIYMFVRRRGGSRAAALIAALLLALDTPTIHIANKLLSETAFTVLLFGICGLTLGRVRPVVIGILCGFLVLIRPIAIVWFAALAIFFAIRRIPARQIAAFCVAALILPAGWAARNAVHTGVFTVSSIAGINMLIDRAGGALAIEDRGNDFQADMRDEANGLVEDADDAIQHRLNIPDAEELPDAVRARYYSQYAWHVIAQHPLGFIGVTVRGILVNLFDSDWDAAQDVSLIYPEIVKLTVGVVPVIEFVLAIIGIFALWRRDRPLALILGLAIVYFVVMAGGGEAEARFRVPVMPQMTIVAAAGVEAAARAIRRTDS